VAPAAAEVAALAAALAENPASPAADERIAAALRSPNELLAGAALRRIRSGAGSPALPAKLLDGLDSLPPARQAQLFEALAARPGAAAALRPVLVARAQAGDVSLRAPAVTALGRVLLEEHLPLVLQLASAAEPADLAAAAKTALARATDAAINPALLRHALDGRHAPAAIDALAARHAVAQVPGLWNLVTADDPAVSAAAIRALGAVMPPDSFPLVIERLVAAEGGPGADACGKLLWNVLRRHPDPAAAAAMLDQHAAKASGETKELLQRYADRIRPRNAAQALPPPALVLDLPREDDREKLVPNGCEEVAYLNCGERPQASYLHLTIRRTAGQTYQFGATPHPLATVDFGREIAYEITGLEADADYILGFSAWDADRNGRRQSLWVNGREVLPDFAPFAFHADRHTYTRIHLPLPRALTAGGKATVTMKSLAGPNAVVSQLWLLRRKPDSRAAKRVVILTGDDYPAHLWRVTGPEFAAILRADPRLEVTISESPHLLGSPMLAAYDAVFLHFKNYHNRLPTSEAVWNNLESYVQAGGGLVIAHFGCGAMQEWNGFVKTAGRVWDPNKRGHDPYGEFLVRILRTGHPATTGLVDFTTTDELYTCLTGDTEIEVLADATSKVDKQNYPMAFVLTPGKGRVFHSTLGHDIKAFNAPGARALYLQGTRWATGLAE
jgi:type 1 glutamine amidotransferase